jgi:RimJ/RimL family protein N-acetyltransferase
MQGCSSQTAKKTLEETEAWLQPVTKSATRPWVENYAIILRLSDPKDIVEPPKMIGTVGVQGLAEVAEGKRSNIGYMINRNFWGRGYATEALNAFLELWFDDKDHEQEDLVAQVDVENWASVRILQKMAAKGYGIREGELNKGAFKIPSKGLRDMRTGYISKGSH